MTQMSPMEPFDHDGGAAADYRRQAREFLVKSRQYLAEDDLHQAAEKGWGAASWMAKAVAETQGWKYSKHDEYWDVMLPGGAIVRRPPGDAAKGRGKPIARLISIHTQAFLAIADDIAGQLDLMDEFLDILEPLAESAPDG